MPMYKYYCEFIDVRSGNARKTGIGAAFSDTNEYRAAVKNAEGLSVSENDCTFLLDFHDKNYLVRTLLMDENAVKTLSGTEPKSVEYYEQCDREYWQS